MPQCTSLPSLMGFGHHHSWIETSATGLISGKCVTYLALVDPAGICGHCCNSSIMTYLYGHNAFDANSQNNCRRTNLWRNINKPHSNLSPNNVLNYKYICYLASKCHSISRGYVRTVYG